MNPRKATPVSTCILVLVGCASAPLRSDPPAGTMASAGVGDPRWNEVVLPAPADWRASLVMDNGTTGIWTVMSFQVFPQYGSPEVVGLDDRGRCHVLVSYSGKWTPETVIDEGVWLGGLAHSDVDPRIAGAEIYTGGKRGNLYQVVAYPHGALDCRLIARLPGMEIHTIVAGDFDAQVPGPAVLVFTRPGGMYRVTPTGPDGTFETELVQRLPGRVRDAVVLPARPGQAREIATVTRAGRLQILSFGAAGPRWRTVYQAAMGLGRLALRSGGGPGGGSGELVLYTALDDGRILRHQRLPSGSFATEVIYRGPQGARGVASGRFGDDPRAETVAIFGYSKEVQLLTRGADGWTAKTIFVDRDKGHWLSAAELDGRNDSDEILISGYGGRVVMLSRPASASGLSHKPIR